MNVATMGGVRNNEDFYVILKRHLYNQASMQ